MSPPAPTLADVSIDLHAHSTVSDGTLAPSELVRAAADAGLTALAITDHDTAAGWVEAADAATTTGVTLVPGMEISCRAGGIGVHVLAYLLDPAHPGLAVELDATRADRQARARRIVERIAVDYDLTWDDVAARVVDGATVGRPHVADAMVTKGLMGSRDEAFDRVLHNGSPYVVAHYAPDAVTAVQLIRAAGGVAVLAHPGARWPRVPESAIAALADAGMAGLEVDHPGHDAPTRARLRGLAGDLGMLVTGSSDYHGPAGGVRLGANSTAPEALEAILAAGTGARAVHG
jgi:hypothetical protein